MNHLGTAAALVAGVGLGYGWQAMNPQEPLLQANLYMQNSAEYRAACIQAYAAADVSLRIRVRATKDVLERARFAHDSPEYKRLTRPMAVVMDLDETVLDNSAFQSYLDRTSKNYSEEDWQRYEQTPQDVRRVPGAAKFIKLAESLGVRPVFISNRWEKNRSHTIEAIKVNGISIDGIDHRLILRDEGESSDKTGRRALAEKLYNVLLYVGDNLRDFSDEFAAPKTDANDYTALLKAVDGRKVAVDKNWAKWGGQWIILPNPVYGEFDKLKGTDPHKMLRPSSLQ